MCVPHAHPLFPFTGNYGKFGGGRNSIRPAPLPIQERNETADLNLFFFSPFSLEMEEKGEEEEEEEEEDEQECQLKQKNLVPNPIYV